MAIKKIKLPDNTEQNINDARITSTNITKWNATASSLGNYLPLSGGTMDNTNLVTNMNADLLDGFHETRFFRGRGTVPANTDISTYSGTVGSYFLNASQISTITNAPYAQSGLHVFSSGSNYGDLQIVSRPVDLAFRVKWGSTDDYWKDWHKIWHDANSNLSTIDWAAKDITAAGTLKATGATTLSSTLTVAGVTTMPKLRITTKHSSSSTSGGIYYYNGSTDYLLIGQGTSNLWIGANETAGTHHTGSTYISGGDGAVYFSRLVSSTRTNYLALDSGNYSSYALPLSGGTMTGSPVLSNAVYLKANNSAGTDWGIIGLNASNNLLIGYDTSGQGYETHLYGGSIDFHYGTGRATGMTLNSSGNVGIGTTTPAYKLDVTGSVNSTTGYYVNGTKLPNITISSSEPTSSDGSNGDIWIVI